MIELTSRTPLAILICVIVPLAFDTIPLTCCPTSNTPSTEVSFKTLGPICQPSLVDTYPVAVAVCSVSPWNTNSPERNLPVSTTDSALPPKEDVRTICLPVPALAKEI